MKEEEDRTATKVEEQVAILTETVAQLTFTLACTAQIASALAYNHKDMKIPVWKDDPEGYKEVEELCKKIIEANEPNGQRETDKS